jgi:hypothetical protein
VVPLVGQRAAVVDEVAATAMRDLMGTAVRGVTVEAYSELAKKVMDLLETVAHSPSNIGQVRRGADHHVCRTSNLWNN